jgi:addiction module HigA family antidote
MPRKLKPIIPGEILLEEFLNPLGISQAKLARDISVPIGRINEIVARAARDHDRYGAATKRLF